MSQVQGFVQAQKREKSFELGIEEKKELFTAVESKSKRETEKILADRMPEALPKERERVLAAGRTEIKFVADDELLIKLERLRDILANRLGKRDPSHAELLEYLADFALKRIAPDRLVRGEKISMPEVKAEQGAGPVIAPDSLDQVTVLLPPGEATVRRKDPAAGIKRKAIPARVSRLVWRRDGSQCTYTAPQNGHRCAETRALEIDHVILVCHGGTNEPDNLRLRCPAHNIYAAIQVLGKNTMQRYVPSLRQ